jgi:hypothetical protein
LLTGCTKAVKIIRYFFNIFICANKFYKNIQ